MSETSTAPAARGWWSRWVALLDHREPATALAMVRICIGLTVLYSLHGLLLTPASPLLTLGRDDGGYLLLQKSGSWLIRALGGPTPELVWGLGGLGLAASVLLVLGIGSRLAAFCALQSFLAVAWINPHTGGSHDHLITNALWLLVLADSGRTLSLRARWATGRWHDPTAVPAWPRYLMVLQLAVMYTSTGLQKVSAHWLPGGDFSALYYILQQPSWARMELPWLGRLYPLTQLATAGTWLFEVGGWLFVLALYFRGTRTRSGRLRAVCNRIDLRAWLVAYGLLLHAGIHLLMDVETFSMASVSLYFAMVHPDELAATLERWRGRSSGGVQVADGVGEQGPAGEQ